MLNGSSDEGFYDVKKFSYAELSSGCPDGCRADQKEVGVVHVLVAKDFRVLLSQAGGNLPRVIFRLDTVNMTHTCSSTCCYLLNACSLYHCATDPRNGSSTKGIFSPVLIVDLFDPVLFDCDTEWFNSSFNVFSLFQIYLTDEEFERVFKVSYSEFLTMQPWKQTQLKKRFKLF